ncbi:MAG: 30S ribosomal protein S16 [Fimbriimonadaceae bacterium]
MVKIRLRRIGSKGRPFYRVVVAKSTAGRNGTFIETIGTYDPVAQPKLVQIDAERALHWLLQGAQPTETTAYLLNKVGVLETFLAMRPNQRRKYGFLDKRTAVTSVASVVEAPAVESKPEPVAEAVELEAPAESKA